jgi:hypothetical protein
MNFVRVIINLFQFNRTNWKAVILCLLAAAIFWLFNAFNKSHSSTIRFPLRFEYNEAQFVPLNPLPHNISINVTGSGWELFRKTFGVKLPELVIPLDRPLEIKKISASTLTPVLIAQLGSLQINYIATDTLRIQLDEKVVKTFHLAVDLRTINYRTGYGNTGIISVLPDTVVIDGPQGIINTIPDTILLPIKASPLSKTFREEVEVPLFKSVAINRNPPVVTVVIEAGPVETIETTVKVTLLNQPRSLKNRFADSVKVRIQIPVDQRENFHKQTSQVKAWIDFGRAKNGSYVPSITGLPLYAQVVSIDSLSYKID